MTTAGDLGWGNPDAPNYQRDHITTIDVEGVRLAVRTELAPIFRGFLTELVHQLGVPIADVADDWGYANRCIRGTGPGTGHACVKSNHAWGTAIDVNATTNPMTSDGRVHTNLPPGVSKLAARWGLRWGGDYTGLRKDPMHFEFMDTPASVRQYPKGQPTRPTAPPADFPRLTLTHHLLEGAPVAKILVAVTLDKDGNGEAGPDEGVHIPEDKFLTVASHAPHSANYGDGNYLLAPAGYHYARGETVIEVVTDNPALAGATVYPAVLVAD